MTDFDRAEKKIKAIRSLLERGATYRTISAFTAFIGGLLSLGGFATAFYAKHHRHSLSPSQFVIIWLVIMGLTALSSLIFLWRDAVNRGEPFFSAGDEMRHYQRHARAVYRRRADVFHSSPDPARD